ncbi:MAG: hypothetical protein V3U29_03785 [Phycisphaeraceae bacterium]
MASITSLESAARELLDLESHRSHLTHEPDLSHHGTEQDDWVVSWLLPDLLALVAESHGQPVQRIAPLIRQLIIEKTFVDECGDCVMDAEHLRQVEQQVKTIVRVLEKVRRKALARGEWSNAPVTPQMFG